jgi:NADP-dependent 3-hydroxy acid dehydrogenase YdfG
MSNPGPIFIVGAGPGVGASVARRFAREGHPVGLVARNRERLDALVAELESAGARAAASVADVRKPAAVRAALDELVAALGPAEILCVSPLPDVSLIKPVTETTAEDFREAFDLGMAGTAAAVTAVVPAMREARTGTLLFTTGSAVLNPNPDRAVSGIVNAAQAAYFRMLHDALAPDGVHVSHTVIVGPIGDGDGNHDPADIAEHIWERHVRRDDVLTEVR